MAVANRFADSIGLKQLRDCGEEADHHRVQHHALASFFSQASRWATVNLGGARKIGNAREILLDDQRSTINDRAGELPQVEGGPASDVNRACDDVGRMVALGIKSSGEHKDLGWTEFDTESAGLAALDDDRDSSFGTGNPPHGEE